MQTDTFQRARSPEHKQRRREAIVAAAVELARRDGVREVSLSDVARAVGIHKSALLRYFETREQIFLVVAASEWREWQQTTSAALREIDAGGSGAAAEVLAQSFVDRPLLCDLLPHAALNLERHASLDAVRAYKQTSRGAVDAVAEALGGALTDLSLQSRREVVSDVALLAGSLYQIATPPEPLARLYVQEPELGHSLLDFPGRLARAAEVVIAGVAVCSR